MSHSKVFGNSLLANGPGVKVQNREKKQPLANLKVKKQFIIMDFEECLKEVRDICTKRNVFTSITKYDIRTGRFAPCHLIIRTDLGFVRMIELNCDKLLFFSSGAEPNNNSILSIVDMTKEGYERGLRFVLGDGSIGATVTKSAQK